MEVFGKDMIIGDFKLSDFGLMLASFSYDGESEDDLGMESETIEEFVGTNPVPLFLGAKSSAKLEPELTIVKNPCVFNNDLYFTEKECREVLRQLTGFTRYKRMQILSDDTDELLYFNIRIISASYQKVAGRVAGIILSGECDSQFAWSKDYQLVYNMVADKPMTFYNMSDDLYNYLLPYRVTITAGSAISELSLVNGSDDDRATAIKNIAAGEIITIDCKSEIVTSSNPGRNVLDDFNLKFPRFVPGENILSVNAPITLTLEYKFPRKVGFVWR